MSHTVLDKRAKRTNTKQFNVDTKQFNVDTKQFNVDSLPEPGEMKVWEVLLANITIKFVQTLR